MISMLDPIRDVSIISLIVRMLLCILCGGAVGMEREYKRRPAGFRTHILVCLGAAMTTMTGEFILMYMHYYTDMGRIGAQVVAGIGFLGAGTIITRKERVRGLTTAAGLWTSAIIGLAIGAGFYEGAVIATLLVLVAELVFARLEHHLMDRSPDLSFYMEYRDRDTLDEILQYFSTHQMQVLELEITRGKASAKHNASALLTVRVPAKGSKDAIADVDRAAEGVVLLEIL